MENLPSPWFLSSDKLVSALDPKTVLQMIAVATTARSVARSHTCGFRSARSAKQYGVKPTSLKEWASRLKP